MAYLLSATLSTQKADTLLILAVPRVLFSVSFNAVASTSGKRNIRL